MADDKDFGEVFEEFRDRHNLHRFEGDSGLDNFEKICETLGYADTGFRHGTPIEHFLSDNPGAVEALLEWIEGFASDDWKEKLAASI